MNSYRVRRQVAGVGFLTVVVLFLAMMVAVYQKAFTPAVRVTLRTDHVGNQLGKAADVKVRGVIVGEVRDIRASAAGAELDLALDPDQAAMIPRDVSARLLPKTLFGERYVNLLLPAGTRQPALADGDVIAQDRTESAVELEKLMSDLLPVLRAVQPDKLTSAINSVAMALEGNGERLGATLVELNHLLAGVNPALPDLAADLRGIADVSRTYSNAAPDLLAALRDLTTTSRTLAEQRGNVDKLLTATTAAADETSGFLRDNGEIMVDLASSSRPALELLAAYAPEYECVLESIAGMVPRLDEAFGKGTDTPRSARFTVEITTNRGKYVPGRDAFRWEDRRGPRCIADTPGDSPEHPTEDGSAPPPGPLPLDAVLAPAMAPGPVPQWSGLLAGPALRGAEVVLR
ncbi:MCE family protein [Saccharopolyspora taberi]|uniref:MCE family protein n=1 Tax=Saccharopolyspora taberi TaxID=60895 RepID=A0ABN3V358_9PSEU